MPYLKAFGLALGVCALAAKAQPAQPEAPPKFEIGVNYAYNNVTVSDTAGSNQNGAAIYGEYFFKKTFPEWDGRNELGISAEFAGSGSGSGSLYTYLFGPRWSNEWRHLRLYGGITAGGARVRVNGVDQSGAPVSFERNTPAVDFAQVGVELLFGSHYVVRLLQADDLSFEVPDPATGRSHWQGGLRASAGIAFRFGQRKP
jgi:hypothetical protein